MIDVLLSLVIRIRSKQLMQHLKAEIPSFIFCVFAAVEPHRTVRPVRCRPGSLVVRLLASTAAKKC